MSFWSDLINPVGAVENAIEGWAASTAGDIASGIEAGVESVLLSLWKVIYPALEIVGGVILAFIVFGLDTVDVGNARRGFVAGGAGCGRNGVIGAAGGVSILTRKSHSAGVDVLIGFRLCRGSGIGHDRDGNRVLGERVAGSRLGGFRRGLGRCAGRLLLGRDRQRHQQ